MPSEKKISAKLTERQWYVVKRALELIEVEDISNGHPVLHRWGLADKEVLKALSKQIGFDINEEECKTVTINELRDRFNG